MKKLCSRPQSTLLLGCPIVVLFDFSHLRTTRFPDAFPFERSSTLLEVGVQQVVCGLAVVSNLLTCGLFCWCFARELVWTPWHTSPVVQYLPSIPIHIVRVAMGCFAIRPTTIVCKLDSPTVGRYQKDTPGLFSVLVSTR